MTQGEDERPWKPGPNLPRKFVLVNPDGTRHLLFDDELGAWFRIFEDRSSQPLKPSEAVVLRPSDVGTILKWTMMWSLGEGRSKDHAYEMINDLADSIRVALMYLANLA